MTYSMQSIIQRAIKPKNKEILDILCFDTPQILYISHQVEDKLDCIGATIFLPDGRIERNLSAFQKF